MPRERRPFCVGQFLWGSRFVLEWVPKSRGLGVTLREKLGWTPHLHTPASTRCSAERRVVGCSGFIWCLALGVLHTAQHGRHLPLLLAVARTRTARPSYLVTHWKRVFATSGSCVEGSRTPDVTFACGGASAVCCELELLWRFKGRTW